MEQEEHARDETNVHDDNHSMKCSPPRNDDSEGTESSKSKRPRDDTQTFVCTNVPPTVSPTVLPAVSPDVSPDVSPTVSVLVSALDSVLDSVSVVTPSDPGPVPLSADRDASAYSETSDTANLVNTRESRCGYVFDDRMLLHCDPHDDTHPETPDRIRHIYARLEEARLLERAIRIPVCDMKDSLATDLHEVHTVEHCERVAATKTIASLEDFAKAASAYNSVYIGPDTALAAQVAVAATVELCHAIATGQIDCGFAIVRPPGHHAEHDAAMGFCLYNNVAVGAASLLRRGLASRILIVDWDIHHGNGTQNAFADSPDVLYVSLHRFDNGRFYPHMSQGSHTYVGEGAGLGTTINVAWNGPGFGDADYLYAFTRLILPVAHEFNPDFVIVSAGFDAAMGDPIGDCLVTPDGFAMMLHQLSGLAGGRLALVLEGGYNLEVISACYEACVRVLLRDPPPRPDGPLVPSSRAVLAVESALLCSSPHWKCLYPKAPQTLSSIATDPPISVPSTAILDRFWREDCCRRRFAMRPLSTTQSEGSSLNWGERVMLQPAALARPDVMVVFAHESGALFLSAPVSSLCVPAAHLAQQLPFLPLLETASNLNYACVDVNVPSRVWRVKQTSLGHEDESEQMKRLFLSLWDRVIAKSGCRRVFFVASGAPIYAIAHLINHRPVEDVLRGVFLFSATLFLPTVNDPKDDWYRRHSCVVIPDRNPPRKTIRKVPASFGSCVSSGLWTMADSAAVVGDFASDIFAFIRAHL